MYLLDWVGHNLLISDYGYKVLVGFTFIIRLRVVVDRE